MVVQLEVILIICENVREGDRREMGSRQRRKIRFRLDGFHLIDLGDVAQVRQHC